MEKPVYQIAPRMAGFMLEKDAEICHAAHVQVHGKDKEQLFIYKIEKVKAL